MGTWPHAPPPTSLVQRNMTIGVFDIFFHNFCKLLHTKKTRDVIRRLCNKDRDQGPKGVGVIIDHVVTYSTLDK